MNTTTATRITRGTAKTHRTNGIDFTKPFLFGGTDANGPLPEAQWTRYERIADGRGWFSGIKADGGRGSIGGVATRFWAVQAEETVEVAPAAPAADDLDSMTFPQLMALAKIHKVPGRGTARIAALREGVRAALAA